MNAIDLAAKLATFSEHFQPRTVGQFNGHDLMVVKVKGPFTWHKHDDTDDFFLVLKGELTIKLRDGDVKLKPGEVFVVPKGVGALPGRGGRSAHPPDRTARHAQHGRPSHGSEAHRHLVRPHRNATTQGASKCLVASP